MRIELFMCDKGAERFRKDLHISGCFNKYGSTKGIFRERNTQKTKIAKTLKNEVLFDLVHCGSWLPVVIFVKNIQYTAKSIQTPFNK